MIFVVLLEVVLAIFICWGIWNEPKLIRFERALANAIIWDLFEKHVEPKLRRMEEQRNGDE